MFEQLWHQKRLLGKINQITGNSKVTSLLIVPYDTVMYVKL